MEKQTIYECFTCFDMSDKQKSELSSLDTPEIVIPAVKKYMQLIAEGYVISDTFEFLKNLIQSKKETK